MSDMQDLAIPFLIFLASILLVQTVSAKIGGKAGLPPSPRALPIIGHMHLLGPIPHQAFHRLSTRYGPLVYFFIGSKPCLLIASTPEVAKGIIKINEASFLNRPKLASLDYLTYGSADFGSRTLDQFLPIRCEERNRFLKLVLKKAEAKEAVDVGGELMRLTNNIISRMLLRTRCSDNENEADEEGIQITGKENPLDFRPQRFTSEDWSANSNMVDVRGQHFHLLPFGNGRRSSWSFICTTVCSNKYSCCFDPVL
ncbi:hypothetical protein POTOM_052518 [Populus tomentosa]|uniref:Uncharacterized protein n=1 Tax=Populus tomentosa TaxID=118781 RepID=A0A8X7YE95_POPTO|nr:hypothetical protein POTOM_052518 [Populus tomentosa]